MSLLLGGIVMWSGLLTDIPENFALCDGQNGTLDLRNKFIIGAGDLYDVEDTGGFADASVISHNHTLTTNSAGSHTHAILGRSTGSGQINRFAAGTASNRTFNTNNGGAHSHTISVTTTGEDPTDKNLPPYFALAFIQQIS